MDDFNRNRIEHIFHDNMEKMEEEASEKIKCKKHKGEMKFGKEKDSIIICYWNVKLKCNGRGILFYDAKRKK